jgi:hypothetical protein
LQNYLIPSSAPTHIQLCDYLLSEVLKNTIRLLNFLFFSSSAISLETCLLMEKKKYESIFFGTTHALLSAIHIFKVQRHKKDTLEKTRMKIHVFGCPIR